MKNYLLLKIQKPIPFLNKLVMKKNKNKNLLLGIFVVTGVILFILGVYFIGNEENIFGNNRKLKAIFAQVSGLQTGNNVRFAGVTVGTVSGIEILSDTAILVHMSIDGETFRLIKKNSVAAVNSDGLVGSMIVDILPGEEGPAVPVVPGDTIRSLESTSTAEMLSTLSVTNQNAAQLSENLLEITREIMEGEGILGELIKDQEMARDLKQSIANLENSSRAAYSSINRFNELLSEVNMDESVLGVLLKDTISAQKITGIINSLEESSQELSSITSNLDEFSQNLNEGEGALNYLTQDTTLVNDINSTIETMETASENFNEIMEAIKHSFLFRGYFRKQERQRLMEAEDNYKSND